MRKVKTSCDILPLEQIKNIEKIYYRDVFVFEKKGSDPMEQRIEVVTRIIYQN